jgi:magnesium-transporting ATPase (P-type)
MIFCDKTGTLTSNQMIMRKCQINGIKYGDEEDESEAQDENDTDGVQNPHRLPARCIKDIHKTLRHEALEQANCGINGPVTSFFEILTLCN